MRPAYRRLLFLLVVGALVVYWLRSPGRDEFAERAALRHGYEVYSVRFVGQGSQAITADLRGMHTWDVGAEHELGTFGSKYRNESDPIISFLDICESKQLLLAGGPGDRLELWDLQAMKVRHTLTGHLAYVTCVALSSDGRFAAAGTASSLSPPALPPGTKSVWVWDAKTGSVLHQLKGHEETVMRIRFLPDSNRLVSIGWDAKLILWDVTTGQGLQQAEPVGFSAAGGYSTSSPTIGLAVDPAGKTLIVALRLWSIPEWKELRQLDERGRREPAAPERKVFRRVYDSAFTPDGQRVLTAHGDGYIRLWDVATGSLLSKALALMNKTPVYSVDISPDGRYCLSAGSGFITDWTINTKKLGIPRQDPFVRYWRMPTKFAVPAEEPNP